MHTLWLREHNQIARGLSDTNPEWDSDRVFNEARKIVQALVQKITFFDWLDVTLSKDAMTKHELNSKDNLYDSTVDGSTVNANVAAAFRRGHSNVPDEFVSLVREPPFNLKWGNYVFFFKISVSDMVRTKYA